MAVEREFLGEFGFKFAEICEFFAEFSLKFAPLREFKAEIVKFCEFSLKLGVKASTLFFCARLPMTFSTKITGMPISSIATQNTSTKAAPPFSPTR